LLICHNFDSPGKIGVVGSILGQRGVNINFMGVAPVSRKLPEEEDSENASSANDSDLQNEALMILGIDRSVESDVIDALVGEGGVLSGRVVTL
jgi:D-3-phosphoglycerate dehydrogenase